MAEAELGEPGIIRVTCGYIDQDRLTQIPGATYDRKTETWKVPLSWASCLVLRGVFGTDLTVGSSLKSWSWDYWQLYIEPAMKFREAMEIDPGLPISKTIDDIEADGDLKLKPYQRADVAFLTAAEKALLANEPGVGKTASLIRTIQVLGHMALDSPFPVLIVCPNSLKVTVWQRELAAWAPELTVQVIDGGAGTRRKQLESGADCFIINWDLLRYHSRLSPYGQEALTEAQKTPKELNILGHQTVIADECVPADTLIRIPSGLMPISKIREGDSVWGLDHETGKQTWAQVTGVRRSPLKPLVKIGSLWLTEDHPVWVSSEDVLCYDNQYGSQAKNVCLSGMRKRIYCTQPTVATANVLFCFLQIKICDEQAGEQATEFSADEKAYSTAGCSEENSSSPSWTRQSFPRQSSSSKISRNTESKRLPESEWRQRYGSYRPAGEVARILGNRLETGISSSRLEEDSRIPTKLQTRYCQSRPDDRDRSSWPRPWQNSGRREPERPEKESVSRGTWLDGSLDLERRNPFGSLWNLETTTGNYFANGILVHNCHKIIHPHSQVTRAAWATMADTHYRFALTGTPVGDHVGDLWGILRGLIPEGFSGKTRYMDRYANTTWGLWGGLEVIGLRPDTAEEFRKITEPVMRRMLKAAVLPQLPPILPVAYRHTPMTPKQAKAYRQMADEMYADLDGEILNALDTLSKLTRLLQFAAASAEIGEDGKVHLTAPSSKVDDLVELLEELGDEQLVVAAVSKQLINLAAARLDKEKISYGLVTGDQDMLERDTAVSAFQSGHKRVILLTLGTGAEGLTLTAASKLLFMQESFRVLENDQCEARIHRIGSEHHSSIQIIKQVTPGTVEEAKIQILQGKSDRIEEILQDREVLARLLSMKVPKGKGEK